MNFAVILAAGKGKRMHLSTGIPKQFIKISGIPIVIYTINKILSAKCFDKVYVSVCSDFIDYFIKLLKEYSIDKDRIIITEGGKERIDTIQNTLKAIEIDTTISNDDVVVICDAVRPFVSTKILYESINTARDFGACVATIPAHDTMFSIEESGIINSLLPRSKIFHGQAPDSFRFNILKQALDSLSEEEKLVITGTAQICLIKGIPVKAIKGSRKNIKITTIEDLQLAEQILESERTL